MSGNLSVFNIFAIAVGAVLTLGGLASFLTGRVFLFKEAGRYTEDSLRAYARPAGVSNIAFGLGLVLEYLLDTTLFTIGSFNVSCGFASLVVLFLIGIAVYVSARKVLVKK